MTTDGPSPCGYHFLSEYQRCPRKWFIRYVLALKPTKTKLPLVFGHAWHAALESWLLNRNNPGSLDAAVQAGLEDLQLKAQEIDKPDELPDLRTRIIKGLPLWTAEFTRLYGSWTVNTVEDLRMVPIADNLVFSVRFDGTITDPDGRVYILEHKTTGWSTDKTVAGVELGDQLTGYYLAYNKTRPNVALPGLSGVLLDVTEFKSTGIKPSFWFLTRTLEDQTNMELSLVGLFNELAQKRASLQDGHPPFVLFPRSSEFCALFGCEYETICRSRLEQFELPPTDDFIVETADPADLTETT